MASATGFSTPFFTTRYWYGSPVSLLDAVSALYTVSAVVPSSSSSAMCFAAARIWSSVAPLFKTEDGSATMFHTVLLLASSLPLAL